SASFIPCPHVSTLFPTRRSSDLNKTISCFQSKRRPFGAIICHDEGIGQMQLLINPDSLSGPHVSITRPKLMYRSRFRRVSPIWIDRKSTRLNSSHGSSSYAVFCL